MGNRTTTGRGPAEQPEGKAEDAPSAAGPKIGVVPASARILLPGLKHSGLCTDPELAAATRGQDFTFDGQWYDAKLVDAYDGDTVRLVFRCGGLGLIQVKARMAGYDSPEMHPKRGAPNRAAEMEAAKAARAALLARVGPAGLVTVRCGAFDKYGRVLVTAYTAAGEDINAWMVANGHGRPYDGGTKTAFGAPDPPGEAGAPGPAPVEPMSDTEVDSLMGWLESA